MNTTYIDWLDLEVLNSGTACFFPELALRVARQTTHDWHVSESMIFKNSNDLLGTLGSITFWHAEVEEDQLVDGLGRGNSILDHVNRSISCQTKITLCVKLL